MTADSILQVAVDIGNSSLKAAPVRKPVAITRPNQPLARNHRYQTSDWLLADPLRINWIVDSAKPKTDSTAHPVSELSCLPTDNAWVEKLLDCANQWLVDLNRTRVQWLISSVNRPAMSVLCDCLSGSEHNIYRQITYHDIPMKALVDFPEKLGIDRLLAAYAAEPFRQPNHPQIIVQAGTAATIDWVDQNGNFCGGAILPGMPLSARLLAQGTDLLPSIEAPSLLRAVSLPGKNTAEAMMAGVVAGFVGGIEWLISKYRQTHTQAGSTPTDPVQVIVSGGDGQPLADYLTPPVAAVDQLVLRGLASLLNV